MHAISGSLRPVAALGLAVAIFQDSPVRAGDPTPVQSVVNRWRQRQDAARTITASWSGNCLTKSYFDPPLDAGAKAKHPRATPATVNGEIKRRIVFGDNGKFRFEYTGSTWSVQEGKAVPHEYVAVFDGSAQKTLFTASALEFPSAHIRKGTLSDAARHVHALPIRMIYRPFDPDVGFCAPSDLSPSNTPGVVGGKPCTVLRRSGGAEATVWVDAKKDFMPVRYYEFDHGRTVRTLEIQYEHTVDSGWVPSRWKDVRVTNTGDMLESLDVVVIQLTLNAPAPPDEFDFSIPPGAWVQNYITKERYIQREGRNKRPILDGEYNGKNYQELLHFAPPNSGSTNLLLPAAAAAVATMGVLYYRRRKAKLAA